MRIVTALLPVVLLLAAAAPAGAQLAEDCLILPGVNERCAAWSYEYPEGDPADDDCSDDPADQVIGPDAVYLTGTTVCSGTEVWDILTIAVDFDGTLLWTARHEGSVYNRHEGFGIAISPDGSTVYVAGADDNGEDTDWIVLAYDAATGESRWDTRYDGPAGDDDEAWVLAPSADGERVYVAGFDRRPKDPGGQDVDIVTASLDAVTGAIDWTARFSSESGWVDHPRGIGIDGDRIVVTGSSILLGQKQDLVTLALRDDRENHRAEPLWTDTYDGGDWDQPAVPCLRRRSGPFSCGLMGTVAVAGDTAVITGTSYIEPTTDDAVWSTIAYDVATGERRWLREQGDPEYQNMANAVAASPDGGTVYVTGFENDDLLFDGIGDAVTVAYDAATGETRWEANQALPAVEDVAGFGLAVTEDDVYMTGEIDYWVAAELPRIDTLVVAYDAATGTRDWVARHNRYEDRRGGLGGSDGASWAAVTPDGSRLLAGVYGSNVLRVENQRDYRDYGVLGYDL